MRLTETDHPLANAMWDYSWLERQYPGGGYDDWDRALDELVDRGYDLVRIEAFPHMIATDPDRTWTLEGQPAGFPWGAPGRCTIDPAPKLIEFGRKCAERDLLLGLTTWFRGQERYEETAVERPAGWGDLWVDTLDHLAASDLLETVAFVDLANERSHPPVSDGGLVRAGSGWDRHTEKGVRWIQGAVDRIREDYPGMDITHSLSGEMSAREELDVSMLDFLEPHLFLEFFSDFVELLGNPRSWGRDYLDDLADKGERLYRMNPGRWLDFVRDAVDFAVEWSETTGLPVVTTEAWGPPRAADWPDFDWSWFKEMDATGVREAMDTGRFLSVCTSNHCGPQFRGMWEDAEWHRDLTDTIHAGSLSV